MKPHDADLHPPGYHPIATVKGGTVAMLNGTAYWLDDNGTQTALSKLPRKRLVELVVDEARTVAQLRNGLQECYRGTNGKHDDI